MNHRDIFIKNIFSSVAVHIDFLSSFLSFGLDNVWRKKLVSLSGIKGSEKVLDVCTGTGKLIFLLSKKVGLHGSVIGVDFCEDMLNIAKKKLNPHTSNVTFIISNAKKLSVSENSFDVVTVAFGMRNIQDTIPALNEIHRVLKPGGRFFCLELTRPYTSWFQSLYKIYCFKVIPFIGKLITKTDVPYTYLPRSIQAFSSPEEFRFILEQCGFNQVTVYPMTFGAATIYGARKSGV